MWDAPSLSSRVECGETVGVELVGGAVEDDVPQIGRREVLAFAGSQVDRNRKVLQARRGRIAAVAGGRLVRTGDQGVDLRQAGDGPAQDRVRGAGRRQLRRVDRQQQHAQRRDEGQPDSPLEEHAPEPRSSLRHPQTRRRGLLFDSGVRHPWPLCS